MRVLVACEFSGVVREAFRRRGHEAMSCDLRESEQPGDGLHYCGDVMDCIGDGWDAMIAFPPCTDLCSAGAVYWKKKQADGRQQRAIDFVMRLAEAPIEKIAIENPVGILSTVWGKPDQIIQPFHFGDPYWKTTCLWLKRLPPLVSSKVVEPIAHWHGGVRRGGKRKDGTRSASKLPTALKYGEKERSRTFAGIAEAMAEQWGASSPQNTKET